MWDRSKKKIHFYAVTNKNQPKQILTLTCTKMQAVDFCYRFLRVKHFDHFKMWCEMRDLDVNSESAWSTYFNNCIDKEERCEYLIHKKVYELNNVAAILRMFGGCLPMGCKFDTENEYKYLEYKLQTQEIASKLMQSNLKEKIDKMMQEELEKPEEPVEDGK